MLISALHRLGVEAKLDAIFDIEEINHDKCRMKIIRRVKAISAFPVLKAGEQDSDSFVDYTNKVKRAKQRTLLDYLSEDGGEEGADKWPI